jgi:hypothetical protein
VKVKRRRWADGNYVAAGCQVRGLKLGRAHMLAARNLRFLRSGKMPLRSIRRCIIRARCCGRGSRYRVQIGGKESLLRVLRPGGAQDGEQVFAQPDAASDTKESFYPQRYVPGALSLALNPGRSGGAYTLVVTMRDEVGHQTAESRGRFRVEP